MKNIFIVLFGIIILEGCRTSQLYTVTDKAKVSIGLLDEKNNFVYNEDFKNTVWDISSKFGERKPVIIYTNEGVIVWACLRRQKKIGEFFTELGKIK